MATSQGASVDDEFEKDKVQRIEREQLAWSNIYRLKRDINKADREEKDVRQRIVQLGRDEARNAVEYKDTTEAIKQYQKDLQHAKEVGNRQSINFYRREIEAEQKKLVEQRKTAGGALMAISLESKKKKESLQVERSLIKDINKERGLGAKIMDLFRSKEKTQRTIDIARAKAGGGANIPGAVRPEGSAEGKKGSSPTLLAAMVSKLGGPLVAIKNLAREAIVAPFAEAANLLSGDSVGMGGGKAKATGVSSILGGLEKIASSIPFIGFLLGPIASAFKGIVEAVLGIDQANFRVARSMNISVDQAAAMRKQFDGIANSSGNLVMNSTRMLQSYIEIGSQLGINAQLSDDIYQNDVKLRDILGLEAESRKVLVDQSIVTGRNAEELTKSAIGTVGAFNKLVGTSFKWTSILSEASKLGGYLGLTLTKYPEKIYKAITATKTLGMDLKQLDVTASSFLDFETSIGKEMEAQVLTGKNLNLTKAREAAMNNDYVTLSAEIAKNVGSAGEYLTMNRFKQEAIAAAVGLTRDGLSDILKKQEIYTRAGVADQKGLVTRLELLQQQKKTQDEISATLGKDGYALATQVSTAEKLTEMMEKLKIAIVNFVKESGLLDFLTDPQKINAFIKTVTSNLAGVVSFIGNLIADIVDLIGGVVGFFGGDKQKWDTYAAQARSGTENFAGTIRSVGENLGGAVSKSVGSTVQQGTRQETSQNQQAQVTAPTTNTTPQYLNINGVLNMDGQKHASFTMEQIMLNQGTKMK
jgi:hypothetical protein